MNYVFGNAKAFMSDISAWARCLCPIMFRRVNTFSLYGASQVCFPIKNTHGLANSVITVDVMRNNGGQDVSKVKTFHGAFLQALVFNSDISRWCVQACGCVRVRVRVRVRVCGVCARACLQHGCLAAHLQHLI